MRSELSMEKRMTETEVLAETPKIEVIAEPVIVSGPWIQVMFSLINLTSHRHPSYSNCRGRGGIFLYI